MRKILNIIVIIIVMTSLSSLYANELFNPIRTGDLNAVKALLEQNPDLINQTSRAIKPIHEAIRRNKAEIVKYLISKGADVNESLGVNDWNGMSWAIRNKNLPMVKLLIENGADINYKTSLNESYLHLAVHMNLKDIVSYLLKRGIDVNIKKNGDLTPLHLASVNGYKEIAVFLITKGADLNTVTTLGDSPLHLARAAGNDDVVKLLKEKGAKETVRAFPKYSGKYLGLNTLGTDPELFAPEIFRDIYRTHSAPAFTADGKELYWEAMFMQGNNNAHFIWYMKEINGKWTAPRKVEFSKYPSGGPAFTPEGKKLFFHSSLPRKKDVLVSDLDIWYVERDGNKWSKPIHLQDPINIDNAYEAYPFISKDNSLYFHRSGRSGVGSFKVTFQNNKAPKIDEFNIFSKDGYRLLWSASDYLIFSSANRKGNFHYEIYISFKDKNGRWKDPVYMGDDLHRGDRISLVRVTFDGKYLFFESKFRFYWVSTAKIESLK